MNGRFLLDTNAVIALLSGHRGLVDLLQNADWIGIPVIVELEFLSFPNLSQADVNLFVLFKSRVEVIGLHSENAGLLDKIVEIRKNANIKLPDAIISGSADFYQATLLSNDAVFQRVTGLSLQKF